MHEALLYDRLTENAVSCRLCCHYCTIKPGHRGICTVRENQDGNLFSLVYGKIIAANVDPIEKKPLYHFYPGSLSFSIATVGCNFCCKHCQNNEIAHYPRHHAEIVGQDASPDQIVDAALRAGCSSISYTYTEPTIFFEFAYDCARLARERGLKNVFVSNGYTGPDATRMIAPYLDANNIDLKGDDNFYRKLAGAHLKPVLDTIHLMKELGIWVEITTLIIPDWNDSEEFLQWAAQFIASVDPAIPWHVTQFHPTYQLLDKPRTPLSTLVRAREIGLAAGLKYVYQGNMPGGGGENTNCPSCGNVVIERYGFAVSGMKLSGGSCSACGTPIAGRGLP
ncbi:MAG TPA: AmmeMemoRadiSam system radical SAM enzyme [Dissulfurispiraceae bacterium]|nr:AmmeMemoRadiSam system radical SAM enzyme [Dissulfurispiraceae bacterium]